MDFYIFFTINRKLRERKMYNEMVGVIKRNK